MVDFDPVPTTARIAAQWSLTLSVFAGTLFVVVLVLGVGGASDVVTIFAPAAVVVTVLATIGAVIALRHPRTRSVGITAAFILVPCVVLSALTIFALFSR